MVEIGLRRDEGGLGFGLELGFGFGLGYLAWSILLAPRVDCAVNTYSFPHNTSVSGSKGSVPGYG